MLYQQKNNMMQTETIKNGLSLKKIHRFDNNLFRKLKKYYQRDML